MPAARARRIRLDRGALVLRLERRLQRRSWPRLQMAVLVALTAATGLLASFVMLQAGLGAMAWRYPLAVGLAYLVFLCLLWAWLRVRDFDLPDGLDLPSMSGDGSGAAPTPSSPELPAPVASGGGGDFAGGGAGGSFDVTDGLDAVAGSVGRSAGKAASVVAEGDELAVPLLIIALALAMAVASLYVVWIAPALFAELLVDGSLSVALYRRLTRGDPPRHWLWAALRRTWLPALATAAVAGAVGLGLQAAAPEAHSLGQALQGMAAGR